MQKRAVLWFTGHSKAGKTTLTKMLQDELQRMGYRAVRLDSDTLPISIIKPQAESWEKRQQFKLENLSFLSRLLYECETIVLIAAVGRFRKWRDLLREEIPNYMEIYLKCPLKVRLERDVDAKYERHKDYFYIYEEPTTPDLAIETDKMTPAESVHLILRKLQEKGYI